MKTNPMDEFSEPTECSNPSTRRDVLKLAIGGLAGMLLPGCSTISGPEMGGTQPKLGFRSIPISSEDVVHVAPGYDWRILYAWGDPVQSSGPEFKSDASNTAEDQFQQAGCHHDGMEFFPIGGSSTHGYLCLNHESFDDGLIHPGGSLPTSQEKAKKGMASCGVSVIEVKRNDRGIWQRLDSPVARRITAMSPMLMAGPAAGHARLQTRVDPQGRTVFGTLGNCAAGRTPWGTYLTCEENFQDFFKLPDEGERVTKAEKRYMADAGLMNHWHEFEDRFDFAKEPNEYNRFGWVVEIDPRQKAPPMKRTALGRFRHENAALTLSKENHVVVYMGDDSKFEYIYKFVSKGVYDPDDHSNIDDLLNVGTLYVAQFLDSRQGKWVELTHGKNGLNKDSGFADQGEVLIHARLAADHVGATTMDRPEWLAVHEQLGEVFVSLTNNSKRGKSGYPATNEANSRKKNIHGHILRWRESGADAAATTFSWSPLILCPDEEADVHFSSPDGMHIDQRGILWVQTDVSSSKLNTKKYERFGNNQVLAVDPVSGDVRRFLTGPVRCEITGLTTTPDGKTLFVNIQHPGQPNGGQTKEPQDVGKYSTWPDGESESARMGRPQCGRPRCATLVIQRKDGGVVG